MPHGCSRSNTKSAIPYRAVSLPPLVTERILAFVRSYGLNFSAIDLIVTPDDRYVFVENNPNGQFIFIEDKVPELGLTDALAACLIRGASANRTDRHRAGAGAVGQLIEQPGQRGHLLIPAARDLDEALALYRDLGTKDGEAEALNENGRLHLASGEFAQAQECHRQALDLARAIASASLEATALAGLGRCAIATGRVAHAQALLRQAHEIFQQIGAADAAAVLAEFNALAQIPAGPH